MLSGLAPCNLYRFYGTVVIGQSYLPVICILAGCVHSDEQERVWGNWVCGGILVFCHGRDFVMHSGGASYREKLGFGWGTPAESTHAMQRLQLKCIYMCINCNVQS